MSNETVVTIEPFAVRVPEAMRLDGCRTTEFYRRLKAVNTNPSSMAR
jgi:hypothetical protein